MQKPKVFFSKNSISSVFNKLISDKDEFKGKKVAVKIHFGEKGCNTFTDPKLIKEVTDRVKELDGKPVLVECNVLYRGSRTIKKNHLNTALEHGFNFADIDILDGDMGEYEIEIPIKNGKHHKTAKIGKGIEKYDSLISIAHFKGHMMQGFGGNIKNIGMGLGSRAGKLAMHADISPHISKRCNACGLCIEACPSDAIKLVNNKAEINKELCIGCAKCIAVCPIGAIKVPWEGATPEVLQERVVEYTQAVLSLFDFNGYFINILLNITKDCDCVNQRQDPIMEDIGILASKDIIALEQASIDLVKKSAGKDIFKENNKVNSQIQIDYGEKLGLGNKEYELVEIN